MISREELLAEKANLDQQMAQCQSTIASSERVRKAAESRIEAIHGATSLVDHLLAKIERKRADLQPQQESEHERSNGNTEVNGQDRPACNAAGEHQASEAHAHE